MRLLTWIPTSTFAFFSAIEPVLPSIPPGWIQGGALGILGVTLWCVFMKVLPAHNKTIITLTEAFLDKLGQKDD